MSECSTASQPLTSPRPRLDVGGDGRGHAEDEVGVHALGLDVVELLLLVPGEEARVGARQLLLPSEERPVVALCKGPRLRQIERVSMEVGEERRLLHESVPLCKEPSQRR